MHTNKILYSKQKWGALVRFNMIVIANKTGIGIEQKIISQLLELSFPYK